jgi:circadian clock protein KaiC
MAVSRFQNTEPASLPKAPTGITGLDEITFGGLPKGRPTLVTGASGSGKTLLAMQFLVNGAQQYGEPGLYVAFEETAEELILNFRSLGLDLNRLEREKKVIVDHVHVDRGEIEQSGEYDLEGLFVRLNAAIDSIQARRIVLDTIEVLFGGLPDDAILRSEVKRLFRWLKEKGVTAVVTGERSGGINTQGLEEFISDCVIVLEHQVEEDISTRRLRVSKYRTCDKLVPISDRRRWDRPDTNYVARSRTSGGQ